MQITFYAAPHSSAIPVASALAELEVPHRRIDLDLAKGEQRRPDFLALNPNGKVPTLVVDGTPMFEALAIMQWLGDRFGVARGRWPAADAPERLAALSWSTWTYVSYSSVVMRLYIASAASVPAELRSTAAEEHARGELRQLLDVLDGRLGSSPYLLGSDFTLVDLIVSLGVMWSQLVGVVTKEHSHVEAWVNRCRTRPSIQSEWP